MMLPDIYRYELENKSSLDPLEAITGFELMVGLIGLATVLYWQSLVHAVRAWRKKRLQS